MQRPGNSKGCLLAVAPVGEQEALGCVPTRLLGIPTMGDRVLFKQLAGCILIPAPVL